ncbi:MAG: hypothetical protein ACD_42C00095G0002 [uncultured bacterium]|nr:MAG: hypothetical protein ACD_42C00095G0002 [uncultured bacterium]OGT26576.1 MAG: hypothetical protein A3B71_02830 [Gammaproteobacteria bacterium RIFCSPHIGHO2_02_FULL_42_43]OGT52003.1 MAG: hypothetical protein A3E54_04335 [Gammaproteobacteria bacterium RIFCSPHIGHO2_12_FULL_41_25]OGT61108.1 MAG: hypothetical protein A3I77_06995 [Gammaproteobacteria bacterium RIFCSPLOWO2_02_FULL_42_14]OGT87036.1 MAG: hypothetical protein A3G86_00715 [Gammaproteobacteria bacterium RIFCSPLOWO2_12_FULL_42_18]
MNCLLLLLLGLIWGSGYVISNYCVHHGVLPLGYGFWQSLGPAIALLLISFCRRVPAIQFEKKYLGYYVMCGIFGIAFPNTLIYFTSQHLPPGIVGVMVNTVPILVYPLAILAAQEYFQWKRMVAVLVGVVGVMIMAIPNVHINASTHIPWILVILLTPLSFAFCAVFIAAKRPVPSDALSLSTGMLLVSSLLLTPIVLGMHSFYLFHFPLIRTDWLILLEITLSTIGYVIFFFLIKRAGPVYYSLVSGTVALTSVFWGWVIFHEIMSPLNFVAISFIVAAIGLISFTPAAASSPPD